MLRGTRLQGGVQTFSTLTVTGQGQFGNGTVDAPSITFAANPTFGWYSPNPSGGVMRYVSAGVGRFSFAPPDFGLTGLLRWGLTLETLDLNLGRDAAGLLGIRESIAVRGGAGFGARSISGSYSVETGDFTILCSTATNTLTVKLPLAPAMNQVVNVKKVSSDANRLIIDGQGNLIDALSTQSSIATTRPSFMLQFSSTAAVTSAWSIL